MPAYYNGMHCHKLPEQQCAGNTGFNKLFLEPYKTKLFQISKVFIILYRYLKSSRKSNVSSEYQFNSFSFVCHIICNKNSASSETSQLCESQLEAH